MIVLQHLFQGADPNFMIDQYGDAITD